VSIVPLAWSRRPSGNSTVRQLRMSVPGQKATLDGRTAWGVRLGSFEAWPAFYGLTGTNAGQKQNPFRAGMRPNYHHED